MLRVRTNWLVLLAALPACGGADDGRADPSLLHRVARGDLAITVRERAEIRAAHDTRVVSQLEGRATLIYLIREGTVVAAGDKVAELDASAITEKRASQAIAVAKARAAVEQARKSWEIMEKELVAAEKTASNRLQIARLRSEKFLGQAQAGATASETNAEMLAKLRELVAAEQALDPRAEQKHGGLAGRLLELCGGEAKLALAMGEMANKVLRQLDEIGLARADLALAADTLTHSRRLAAKEYVTRNELERDVIQHKRQASAVALAWNDLQLLVHYTLPETLIGLHQEVENASLELDSVRAANEARRVREGADLASAEAELTLAQERLDNCNQQIANAVMRAPAPGLVVYGRFDWDEPVYEGMEVRERQDVVILPDVRSMVAELRVHEAQIDKVAAGQPAVAKVDAFPGRSFPGRVSAVAALPDASPRMQDLKVYRVTVLLDGDNQDRALRPGMNATVEIDVGVLRDVVAVPLPAIRRNGDTHYVWLATDQGPAATEVQLGGNNLTHVEILSGLDAGATVHLVEPHGARPPAASDGKAGAGGNGKPAGAGANGPAAR
ncbi:MAG: HlyD family efflux transporter periplasmic adaptor subunit [Planctomycetes bacterium]|nr:HlyD family efflux transporter periplasmic adaptor subunit [Planctomycetota bacterium]